MFRISYVFVLIKDYKRYIDKGYYFFVVIHKHL